MVVVEVVVVVLVAVVVGKGPYWNQDGPPLNRVICTNSAHPDVRDDSLILPWL